MKNKRHLIIKTFKLNGMIITAMIFFLIGSCKKDDDQDPTLPSQQNIAEIIQSTDDLSSLVDMLDICDSGIINTLKEIGPFTVFVSSNNAIKNFLGSLGEEYKSLEDFDTPEGKAILATILKYHIVVGKTLPSTDLKDKMVLTTSQGENLTLKINDEIFIDDATDTDAKVTKPDFKASNGIVHIIDKVLVPKEVLDLLQKPLPNIVEIIQSKTELSQLVKVVLQADPELAKILTEEGPFTVFAPTNEAVTAMFQIFGAEYKTLEDFDDPEEMALLAKIIRYNLISGTAVLSKDLDEGTALTTMQGEDLTVRLSDGLSIVDATETYAKLSNADITANNGVVHITDKVLIPQEVLDELNKPTQNIVELVQANPQLSLLIKAVLLADPGLVSILGDNGSFTVFAATNTAVTAMFQIFGADYKSLDDFDTPEKKAHLAKIIRYNLISGTANTTKELTDRKTLNTMQGENITVSLSNGLAISDATDFDAKVAQADILATNGVIHIMDKVLIPQEVLDQLKKPTQNIVKLIQADPQLKLMGQAVLLADSRLVGTLRGNGPFTVFAATDQVLTDLFDVLGDDYNSLADFDTPEDKALLAKIIRYNLISGSAATTNELTDGIALNTMQGENIVVSLSNGLAFGDATEVDARVTQEDILATNGVIHYVDKVLIPQEVLNILATPKPSIIELVQTNPELSLLVKAVIQSDSQLLDILNGEGPFTVFAPTNQAITEFLGSLGFRYTKIEDFDTPQEKEFLAKALSYYAVTGTAFYTKNLTEGLSLTTIHGDALVVHKNGSLVYLADASDTDAKIISANYAASNGVLHIVDKVLLPQEVLNVLGL